MKPHGLPVDRSAVLFDGHGEPDEPVLGHCGVDGLLDLAGDGPGEVGVEGAVGGGVEVWPRPSGRPDIVDAHNADVER